ncbi:unnamed protein product [Gadus morhua 'NCC']
MLRKGFKASSFTLESIHLRAIHSPLKAIHYDTFTEVLLETAKVLLRESATDYNLRPALAAPPRGTAGGSPPTLSSAQQACITARGTAGGP